ncbi:MAG: NAD(+)/NADH kinase, partial [Clostridiales bacterium]
MTKIAIILNGRSMEAKVFSAELAEFLSARSAEVYHPEQKWGFELDDLSGTNFTGIDAAVVLGGDGSMLASGRNLAKFGVPLLGVNMGRMGFLSETEKAGAYAACERLLTGDYQIEERMLLQSSLYRDGTWLASCNAFNDFVVNNSTYIRSVMLDLLIDGQLINSYQGDGIIVSSPTGSTGYSFSAGGPIVASQMDLLLITPVCPHSFFSRPIVVSPHNTVSIICRSDSMRVSLTADGQHRFTLHKNDMI